MPSYRTCPATCELCGNWLPQHNASCPRNGVHPSQWSLNRDNVDYDKSILVHDLEEKDDEYYNEHSTEHPQSTSMYTLQ